MRLSKTHRTKPSDLIIRIKAKSNISKWLGSLTWLDFQRGAVDIELLIVVLALILFGFTMTFSGYYHFSAQQHAKGLPLLYFITRQFIWLVLGGIGMIFAIIISPKALYRLTPIIFISVLILNLFPVLGLFSQTIRGGRRWLSLGGFSFQPSELAKLALVLYLARIIHGHNQRLATSFRSALKPMIMVTIMGLVVYLQNDLSTSVLLFSSALLILYMGGMSVRYLVLQLTMMLAVGVMAIVSSPFRIERLMIWLRGQDNDPYSNGRQALMALRAIRNSGFFGAGLGAGRYKLGTVSLVQSDYIFVAVVEELGILGVLSVVSLFTLLLIKAYDIAHHSKNRYVAFLAISIGIIITGQAFINMAVVIGLFPVTGLPLPFFSAGGSNLFVSMTLCGLLLNLSRSEESHG